MGDEGPQLEALSKMFIDPMAYGALPFKNVDTPDGEVRFTGFFLPAHRMSFIQKFVDKRGYTDYVEYKKYLEQEREGLKGKDLMIHCAEYCFTPEEALSLEGENMFDAELISNRLAQIKAKMNYKEPKRINLTWDPKDNTKVIATTSSTSKILVVEEPKNPPGDNCDTYKNLYVAGIDSIDQGSAESASDYDVSNFCMVIKKRRFGMDEPKYVAMYMDRPKNIREAYEIALKLCVWYNCKVMLEYTKISVQRYFQERHADKYFMIRPEFAVSANRKRIQKRLIGVPSTENVINHGLELIANFITDHFHSIDFEEMLMQMLKYSYVAKRKFDIIAAMGLAEIGDEELFGFNPRAISNPTIHSQWKDIGYYTDEDGHIQYGVIEDHTKPIAKWKI